MTVAGLHSFIATDNGVDCQICGLHVDDPELGYPLACEYSECTVFADDGYRQSHHIIAAARGSECYHCGCAY
jgi:hypothetical protein